MEGSIHTSSFKINSKRNLSLQINTKENNGSLTLIIKNFIHTYFDIVRKLNDKNNSDLIEKYNHMLAYSGWVTFLWLFNIITPVSVLLIMLFHDSRGFDYYWIIISRLLSVLIFTLWSNIIIKTPIILENVFPGLMITFGLFTTLENLSSDDPKILEIWVIAYFGMFMIIFIWCLNF